MIDTPERFASKTVLADSYFVDGHASMHGTWHAKADCGRAQLRKLKPSFVAALMATTTFSKPRDCRVCIGVPESQKHVEPVMNDSELSDLLDRADAAGNHAALGTTPQPMFVVEHSNPLDDNSPVIHRYPPVMDGVCGFAWVTIRPGNGRLARFIKTTGRGSAAYGSGVSIWIGQFGQSYERKYAYARAFAGVLHEAGFDASADGRLD